MPSSGSLLVWMFIEANMLETVLALLIETQTVMTDHQYSNMVKNTNIHKTIMLLVRTVPYAVKSASNFKTIIVHNRQVGVQLLVNN